MQGGGCFLYIYIYIFFFFVATVMLDENKFFSFSLFVSVGFLGSELHNLCGEDSFLPNNKWVARDSLLLLRRLNSTQFAFSPSHHA